MSRPRTDRCEAQLSPRSALRSRLLPSRAGRACPPFDGPWLLVRQGRNERRWLGDRHSPRPGRLPSVRIQPLDWSGRACSPLTVPLRFPGALLAARIALVLVRRREPFRSATPPDQQTFRDACPSPVEKTLLSDVCNNRSGSSTRSNRPTSAALQQWGRDTLDGASPTSARLSSQPVPFGGSCWLAPFSALRRARTLLTRTVGFHAKPRVEHLSHRIVRPPRKRARLTSDIPCRAGHRRSKPLRASSPREAGDGWLTPFRARPECLTPEQIGSVLPSRRPALVSPGYLPPPSALAFDGFCNRERFTSTTANIEGTQAASAEGCPFCSGLAAGPLARLSPAGFVSVQGVWPRRLHRARPPPGHAQWDYPDTELAVCSRRSPVIQPAGGAGRIGHECPSHRSPRPLAQDPGVSCEKTRLGCGFRRSRRKARSARSSAKRSAFRAPEHIRSFGNSAFRPRFSTDCCQPVEGPRTWPRRSPLPRDARQ